MSLYREPGRRRLWPAVAAAAALLVAVLVGFLLGRATADNSLEAAIEPVRSGTDEVLAALELLIIHYPDEGTPSPAQQEVAQANVDRMNTAFRGVRRDLTIIAPEATGAAIARLTYVAALVEDEAPGDRLRPAVERAEEAIRQLPGAR